MNVEISELIGKTLISIDKKDDELIFICTTGEIYALYQIHSLSLKIDDDSEITSKFSDNFNNAFIIE